MAFFNGWGSTASRLEWEPLLGDSLFFTIKFLPEIAGTHFLSTLLKDKQQKYWSKARKEYTLVVAKMLFPEVDEGFWLYYKVSDTKISELILCLLFNFALMLKISCWAVKKNLARLRGDNILSSCINAQPIMINSIPT